VPRTELDPHLPDLLLSSLDKLVWPASAHILPSGDVTIGGVPLSKLAAQYGTPTYLLDTAEFGHRCDAYLHAFTGADVAYAGKALLTRTVVRLVEQKAMLLDVCSEGELALALSADFPASRIILHGNAKPDSLLMRAVAAGVGRIVVDCLDEIDALARLVSGIGRQRVLLRLTPDVDARTHPAITTGTDTQKFGLSIKSGAATQAVRRVLSAPGLELIGLHCHIGSQISSTEPYVQALGRVIDFLAEARDVATIREVNIGGGHAIAYTAHDVPLPPDQIADALRATLATACAAHRMDAPRLIVEPGRAIAGPSGITLYRVLGVKHTDTTTWVTVDGGMSDNPRPALYAARYTARLVGRVSPAPEQPVTVVGRHCEAGDVLVENALLPGDVATGDLVAVPASGGYHYSMASNYNMTPRPPLIAVSAGHSHILVRRETIDDLMLRDLG
jgi:diaminopimelate decarboxylase